MAEALTTLASPWWLLALALVPLLVALRMRAPKLEARVRSIAGTTLRALAVALLVVALAGPLTGERSRRTDVVLALDVSRSVDPAVAAEALRLVNRAFTEKDPAARMGLVVFAADAAVEVLPRAELEPIDTIATEVGRDATDIARALEVASSAFPAEGQRRIVLLSDGRETQGRARASATVARSLGIEIHTIALDDAADRDEVSLRDLSAPSSVRVHEPFEVRISLESAERTRAHLVLMRNGTLLRDARVDLEPGPNVFSFVEQVTEAGLLEYEAVINSDADSIQENNRYQTFVEVQGAPRVLYAVDSLDAQRFVPAALRAQGLSVDEIPGSALPATMHRLTDYDLVVLDDVSGFDVSLAKMELIEDFVRDGGGGLIMLGGDRSFSAGGYYDTPIERVLPVDMDVRTQVRIPSLAVVVVLDKSGSMSSQTEGEEKLEIAKSAALAAVEVLNPLDRVGVLAFDAGFEWVVPITEAGSRRAIVDRLRALAAGGGTDLYVGLDEAQRALTEQPAKVKHLIVLSDGLSDTKADFDALATRVASKGITISTVAFGHDADRELMARIAEVGKGRFYFTDNVRNVPRIFTSETMVVSRGLVVERPTAPALAYPGELLDGLGGNGFPTLLGYQRTFAKPAAQVLLESPDGDPLLATWRYGLGRSVTFAADLAGRWGREWVGWSDFGRFAAQMARWTMRHRGDETLTTRLRRDGQRGEIVVDALDREDRFMNGLDMQAAVVGPDRETESIALEQVAPGRYRGEFTADRAGRYYVNVTGRGEGIQVGPRTFGMAVPYSAEFVDRGVDRETLRDIAETTGGAVLPLGGAALPAILAAREDDVTHHQRLWWPFLVAALVALLLEIAVRKVVVPSRWIERWRHRPAPRHDTEPGYDELVAEITRTRERHLEALRGNIDYRPDDPEARARLYVGR